VSRLADRAEMSYGTLRRFPPAVQRARDWMEPSFVTFLFHDGIVVYDFVAVPAFLGNEGVRDRYDGS
jgi:hypothetical protein